MRAGRRLALLVSAVLLLGMAGIALAQEASVPGGKLRTGDEVLIGEGTVVEGDLYAFAGIVIVEGEVTGDLVAVAGEVTVLGRVGGDVLAAAGTVGVSGLVGGDVRLAGGQVDVAGQVAEDGVVAAAIADVSGGVGEDLVVAAGQLSIPGAVNGDVLGTASIYDRSGSVGGEERLRIGGGDEQAGEGPVPTAVRRYAAVLLFGLLALRFLHRPVSSAARAIEERPGGVLGRGVLVAIGSVLGPLAALFVVTLLAILLAIFGLGDWSALLLASTVVAWVLVGFGVWLVAVFAGPVVVGLWLGDVMLPDESPMYASLALGVGALVVAGMFPVVGAVAALATFLLGAGAIVAVARPPRPTG